MAQRLRGRLEAMLKKLETAAPRRGPSTVDPEAVKRLASLGYVNGGVPLPASATDVTREDPKDFHPDVYASSSTRRPSSSMPIATNGPSRNCWKSPPVGPDSSSPINCWLPSP